MILWVYFLNLVSLAALRAGRGASKRNCVAQRNAGRGARSTGEETRGGAPGYVRWGIADQRREGGIAATLIRQRRPAERQAVFLPCGSVHCTYHSGYYVYQHPLKVFLLNLEQRSKRRRPGETR